MRKLRNTTLLLLAMNFYLLGELVRILLVQAGTSPFWCIALTLFLQIGVIIGALTMEILPCYEKGLNARLQILSGGYELIVSSVYALFIEVIGYILLCNYNIGNFSFADDAPRRTLIINGCIAGALLISHFMNGFWRTAFCSAQLGILFRLLMFFFWWVVPFNIILFYKWCAVVRRELITAKNQYLLSITRIENAVCCTKYPVVMVHGIFFRDWQFLNYWGRVPKSLKQNGANVFYGEQQSSRSVEDSAAEIKAEILRVLEETGAEKVNIIAHSKGGLDARYAISRLGLAKDVASLTTINTPHRGCHFADVLLKKTPRRLIQFIAGRYNALFRKLGDESPDFLSGVNCLTASYCASFNEQVPDAPNVYYQSVMSKMRNRRSASFPLNLTYPFVRKYDGENDGLVGIHSAPWGNYLGLLTAGKKGISHGDMIDLTHKDIKNFDVSEFYVKLFQELKARGY